MDSKERAGYKTRLVRLRARLIREISSTEEALREDVMAPGEHPLPTHPADQDAEGLHEQLAITQNEELILNHVEAALVAFVEGRFGVCLDCGRGIGEERLDAIPYTPWCIDCAPRHEGEILPSA
jgi:RNA polymerase-binding transcription factor DksA